MSIETSFSDLSKSQTEESHAWDLVITGQEDARKQRESAQQIHQKLENELAKFHESSSRVLAGISAQEARYREQYKDDPDALGFVDLTVRGARESHEALGKSIEKALEALSAYLAELLAYEESLTELHGQLTKVRN